MPQSDTRRLAARWIGWSPVRVFGLTPTERLRRALARAGVWDAAPWTGGAPSDARGVLLLLGDHVYDEALVAALAKAPPGTVLASPEGRAVGGHAAPAEAEALARLLGSGAMAPQGALRPADLASAHNKALRKREEPMVMAVTEDSRGGVEDRLFAASYKGVTDVVTKYAWPAPARAVTAWAAERGITPNGVTMVSLVLTIAAFALFWSGWLWSGLLCAWGMTFLDTVDGKLARVTLTSSRFGDVLDHGLDLVHPPFWYWAWFVGTGAQDPAALAVVIAGYGLLRAEEGLFLWRFGIEMHVWRPFDSRFRLVTSRRNPNLLLLTLALLAGAPSAGLTLAAAWSLVSLAVHGVRILQALTVAGENGRLGSWLEGQG